LIAGDKRLRRPGKFPAEALDVILESLERLCVGNRVKAISGFIQNKNFGVTQQRSCNSQALFHSKAETAEATIFSFIQSHFFQNLINICSRSSFTNGLSDL